MSDIKFDRPLTGARIETGPLRAKIVERAEDYPHSSYRVHGLGELNEWVDPLVTYEQLSPYAKVRQRIWAEKVHLPLAEATVGSIGRSAASGLPYGSKTWVNRLAKRLDLDLTIRPRGRPRKLPDKK